MFPSDSIWFWCPTKAKTIAIIKRKSDGEYGLLIDVPITPKLKLLGDYDNKDEHWRIVQEISEDKVTKCLRLSIDQILSLIHGESTLLEERKLIFWHGYKEGLRHIVDLDTKPEQWYEGMNLNFPGWETEQW